MRRGAWYAVSAYFIWGLFPIYWKWLQQVSALQLIGHRIVWSCVMLFAIIVLRRDWKQFRSVANGRRLLWTYAMAGVLIAFNWLIYVWAVNSGLIVETSLGYFINPLVSILLGVFVLGERLRLGQWIPIGLAAAGVLYLTVAYGSLPWVALALAFTFGLYGMVKKIAPLGAVHGLALETLFLLPVAVGYLAYMETANEAAFLHTGLRTDALLVGCGLVTTVPLLLFAEAAHRIPLTMIGLFQYLAPTLQFLLGVLVYREPLTSSRLIGFTMVWIALLLAAVEGAWARRT